MLQPLDLGHEKFRNLYDTDSCSAQNSVEKETALLSRYSIPTLIPHPNQSEVTYVSLEDSSSGFPNSLELESVPIKWTSVEHASSNRKQFNSLVEEHIAIAEHFLNECCEKLQYKNSSNVE